MNVNIQFSKIEKSMKFSVFDGKGALINALPIIHMAPILSMLNLTVCEKLKN